jgi:hypothetical protein
MAALRARNPAIAMPEGGADEPRARDHSTQRRRFMTPITFRTRVNVVPPAVIAFALGFIGTQLARDRALWNMLSLAWVAWGLFLVWMFAGEVSLSVSDTELRVSGSRRVQRGRSVPIAEITHIRYATNPILTFALRRSPRFQEFPRFEIRCNRFRKVVVAPTDPEAFVAALLARNPAIAVEAGKRVPGVAGLRS